MKNSTDVVGLGMFRSKLGVNRVSLATGSLMGSLSSGPSALGVGDGTAWAMGKDKVCSRGREVR
jgi:hypothetical protein